MAATKSSKSKTETPEMNAETSTTTAAADTSKPTQTREAPDLTSVSTAVPIPDQSTRRPGAGRTSVYPFDDLTAVGQSFGVKNKTKSGMASAVTNQNKKNRVKKTDENGNIVFKTQKVEDGNGNVSEVPTEEPEMVDGVKFYVGEVNPSTDPDGASVRVWRVA